MDILNKEDEYIMYILVNSELKMKTGKISSQCCHSSCKVIQILENFKDKPEYYVKWLSNGYPKIILKADEITLKMCIDNYNNVNKEIWCVHTIDLGRTQIKPNSLTSVAFNPILRKSVPEFIKTLKLL